MCEPTALNQRAAHAATSAGDKPCNGGTCVRRDSSPSSEIPLPRSNASSSACPGVLASSEFQLTQASIQTKKSTSLLVKVRCTTLRPDRSRRTMKRRPSDGKTSKPLGARSLWRRREMRLAMGHRLPLLTSQAPCSLEIQRQELRSLKGARLTLGYDGGYDTFTHNPKEGRHETGTPADISDRHGLVSGRGLRGDQAPHDRQPHPAPDAC